MGNTEINFTPGEALDGSGLPVLISNPIDDVNMEKFWEMMINFIMKRKPPPNGFEKEYTCKALEDGTWVSTASFEVTGLSSLVVGHLSGSVSAKVSFDENDKDMMVTCLHLNDPTLAKESRMAISYLKAHHDPLRLEFWAEGQNWRAHGALLASEIAEYLKKEFLLASYYSVIGMSEDKKSMFIKDLGTDETLTTLNAITHGRLVPDPLRLEVWVDNLAYREGGPKAKNVIEPAIVDVFKFAKGESDQR